MHQWVNTDRYRSPSTVTNIGYVVVLIAYQFHTVIKRPIVLK